MIREGTWRGKNRMKKGASALKYMLYFKKLSPYVWIHWKIIYQWYLIKNILKMKDYMENILCEWDPLKAH